MNIYDGYTNLHIKLYIYTYIKLYILSFELLPNFGPELIHAATLAGPHEGRAAPLSQQHLKLRSNQHLHHTCESRCL